MSVIQVIDDGTVSETVEVTQVTPAVVIVDAGIQGAPGPATSVADEGTLLPQHSLINFTGPGVTAAEDAPNSRININVPGGVTLQDEGVPLTFRPSINFVGTTITAADDSTNNRTNVTIDLSSYAPLASPTFTGDPKAPTPASTDNDTSLATTAFVHAVIASGIDVKAVLTALQTSTPDKLIWEYPTGTDIIEFWGDRTASGYAALVTDDFSVDTTTLWNKQGYWKAGWYTGGAINTNPTNSTAADIAGARNDGAWGAAANLGDTAGASALFTFAGLTDVRAEIGFYWFQSGWAPTDLKLTGGLRGNGDVVMNDGWIGGENTVIVGNIGPLTAGRTYKIQTARNGNTVNVTVTRNDTGAQLFTYGYLLPSGSRAQYGIGSVATGVLIAGVAYSHNVTIDDATLLSIQPEARDLWVAVTPSGGVRTVKRIFGSSGSATFRSDFVLGTDTRLTDSRAPTGAAGGVLSGTYPNPTIANNVVTSAHIVDGTITLNDLSATGTKDATTYLRGDNTWATPAGGGGGSGLAKVTSFPGSPADGDAVVRTDLNGSPIFTYSTENGWEQMPRMGAQTIPAAYAYSTTDNFQSIPNTTTTVVTSLTGELYDTDGIHDLVTNPGRMTIKTPGLYQITGRVAFASASGGSVRQVILMVNGAGVADSIIPPNGASNIVTVPVTMTRRLAAGDYVELAIWQDSGGNLLLRGNAGSTSLSVSWLGGAGQTVDERGVPAVKAIDTSGTQVLTNGAEVGINFNTNIYDTDGIHSTTTNTSRFTAKTPGVYNISANLRLPASGTTGTRYIYIKRNGTDSVSLMQLSAMSSPDINISGQAQLAAGDYLELWAYQNSGSSVTLPAASTSSPFIAEFAMTLAASGKTVTPFARVYKSTTSALPSGAQTAVPFDLEHADNDGIHDTVTNNTRLTCRTAGVYAISGAVAFTGDNTGTIRQVRLMLNGVTPIAAEGIPVPGSNIPRVSVSTMYELAVGDYVELNAYHDATSTLNATVDSSCEFSMVKVGAPIAGNSGIEVIEGWHTVGAAGEPALQNGYAVQTGGGAVIRFKKDRNRVTINGVANAAARTAGQQIVFTLPAGYRPSQLSRVPMLAYAGTGYVLGALTVDTAGNVTVRDSTDSTVPTTFTWMPLEISFMVD